METGECGDGGESEENDLRANFVIGELGRAIIALNKVMYGVFAKLNMNNEQ